DVHVEHHGVEMLVGIEYAVDFGSFGILAGGRMQKGFRSALDGLSGEAYTQSSIVYGGIIYHLFSK
ncbi:MAG: hypothetical protein ACOCW2_02455, partial [Chitinivibrionales bacterium]